MGVYYIRVSTGCSFYAGSKNQVQLWLVGQHGEASLGTCLRPARGKVSGQGSAPGRSPLTSRADNDPRARSAPRVRPERVRNSGAGQIMKFLLPESLGIEGRPRAPRSQALPHLDFQLFPESRRCPFALF